MFLNKHTFVLKKRAFFMWLCNYLDKKKHQQKIFPLTVNSTNILIIILKKCFIHRDSRKQQYLLHSSWSRITVFWYTVAVTFDPHPCAYISFIFFFINIKNKKIFLVLKFKWRKKNLRDNPLWITRASVAYVPFSFFLILVNST